MEIIKEIAISLVWLSLALFCLVLIYAIITAPFEARRKAKKKEVAHDLMLEAMENFKKGLDELTEEIEEAKKSTEKE